MVAAIEQAMPAEEVGAAGRHPGTRVNAVHLWSLANIYLLGRKMLMTFGMADDTLERTRTVLEFWRRAALSYRGDGHLQAWDAGFVLRPYGDDLVADLAGGAVAVDDERRAAIKRLNATLVSYLFLLYFDTRVGTGDSGPYPLPGGRTLLVRDFYQMGESDFAWSAVARDMPYQNLTAALVLDGVDVRVNDWGTSITAPEDYLDHLVAFGLYTSDGGTLQALGQDELDSLTAAVRRAQAAHYRQVAAMSHGQKVDAGAYVYFSFLRPFAEVAGVTDALDWTIPRDTVGPIYDAFQSISGDQDAPVAEADEPYYLPLGATP